MAVLSPVTLWAGCSNWRCLWYTHSHLSQSSGSYTSMAAYSAPSYPTGHTLKPRHEQHRRLESPKNTLLASRYHLT